MIITYKLNLNNDFTNTFGFSNIQKEVPTFTNKKFILFYIFSKLVGNKYYQCN